MSLVEEVLAKVNLYLADDPTLANQTPSTMMVDFVIEKFRQHRNYPPSFSETDIEADIRKHLTTIAMAVVDIFAKYGAEGETSHSENSVTRKYGNSYVSEELFSDILPFIKTL